METLHIYGSRPTYCNSIVAHMLSLLCEQGAAPVNQQQLGVGSGPRKSTFAV
jgi:hypothetical protein